MLKHISQQHDRVSGLNMPAQQLRGPFVDARAPGLANRPSPVFIRTILFSLSVVIAALIASILVLAFQSDDHLGSLEAVLIALMALLAGWEAIPSVSAIIGFYVQPKPPQLSEKPSLKVAILATIRNENADEVILQKLGLLRQLLGQRQHDFSLHILSDSTTVTHVEHEKRCIRDAIMLPVFYSHRRVNTDFKSGNIHAWVERSGSDYDAFIILDADSELDVTTTLALVNTLASDAACGLIQTVPVVKAGNTLWQLMQSVASQLYGSLQGQGLSAWMGDEANYYGHNAIIRTRAFAASAGLPHLAGVGLWNGPILSHDFVEAALLRRAGWGVKLLPTETGSFEQAPADVIAHLKRDARWCLGNFQHSRVLASRGLHPLSRYHLLTGIFVYGSSAVWLATLVLWGLLDVTKAGVGGYWATAAFALIGTNLLLPRLLSVLKARSSRWHAAKTVLAETVFSSLFAPCLMVQRVMMMARVLANRPISWAPHQNASRSFPDVFIFHKVEVLLGLGLLAGLERGILSFWFLPFAACLSVTPILSWQSARPTAFDIRKTGNGTQL